MRVARRIVIGLGVAGFLLCCATVLFFNRTEFGWQALSIPTGSMRPTMPPGSLVLVHRVPDSSLRVGDVITYTNPLTMRSTLTHRIIKMYKTDGRVPTFITRGDANPSPDPPVVEGLVQGREVWHMPYIGEFLMLAKTWVGIAVLVYIPAILIMAEETRRLADYMRKMKPYQLEGWHRKRSEQKDVYPRWALAGSAAIAVAITGLGWQTAGALTGGLRSNTVSLAPNVLTISKQTIAPPPSCNGDTNVSNSNTTNQTAASGNANAQNSGSAVSGSATNSNSTTITVTTSC